MQISVENTGLLQRKVRVNIPEERVSAEINNRLQNLIQTGQVQGFRQGKTPLKVIQGRYGVQVRKEVVGKLVQSSLYEAISQENLRPVAFPRIDDIDDESGKNLSYTASFEIYPEIKLKPFDEIKLERPVCDISDNDIDNMIATLREQRRELKPVERPAKDRDILNIDFEGFIDGEGFAGGKAENYVLELGSGIFIEGFEAALIGKSAGDSVRLNLVFPEDYVQAALRGKPVEFNVTVNTVNEAVLPEVDAAFMKIYGVQGGDEAAFRNEVKRNLERELRLMLRHRTKEILLDTLYREHTIALPEMLVENERNRFQQEVARATGKQQGTASPAFSEEDVIHFTEQAERRVALQLIVAEIIRQNDLKADEGKVREMVEQLASAYADPNAIIEWYYSNEKNLAEVEALVLENAMIDWILERANIMDKPCAFDEIMNKRQITNLNNDNN